MTDAQVGHASHESPDTEQAEVLNKIAALQKKQLDAIERIEGHIKKWVEEQNPDKKGV